MPRVHRLATAVLVGVLGTALQAVLAFGPLAPRLPFLKYPVLAERFLAGDLDPERLLDVSFLYFYLSVAVRAVTEHAELVMRALQVGFVGLTAALLCVLVEQLLSRRAAVVAAGLFLLERTVTAYAPILEPEPLLVLAVVAFLVASLDDDGLRPALAGGCLAAALLVRPVLAPLVVAAPLWLALRATGWRQALRRSAVFLLPVALAVAALGARNAMLPLPFSPGFMNPGAVFFEGNQPWATGFAASYPPLFADLLTLVPESPDPHHELYRLVARREAGAQLSVREVNRVWRQRASRFLREYPGAALRRAVARLGEAFRGYAWHDLENAYWRERRLADARVPAVPFAALSAFGLLGMALMAREWRRWLPLYVVTGCQLAAMTVVYVSARQKLVLVPVLVVFAVAAGARLAERCRGWRGLLPAGALLAALLWLPSHASREDRHLWKSVRQSNDLRRQSLELRAVGRLPQAAEAAARALALTPWRLDRLRPAGLPFGAEGFAGRALVELGSAGFEPSPSRRFDAATLAVAAGESEQAASILAALSESDWRAARGSDQSSEPRVLLAWAALLEGDRERAAEHAGRGLARAPGDPEALALVAVLDGDALAARDLERYFGPLHRGFFIGRAALAADDAERAVEELTQVAATLPEFRRASFYLAAALGRAGRLEEGVAVLRGALAAAPEPLPLENQVIALVEQWAAAAPDDARRTEELERVRRIYGRAGVPGRGAGSEDSGAHAPR